ncbi:hypothetical protein LguiA_005220 [Lonicera macranthoides]
MGWNYEDKAIVSSLLGTKGFDYLIPSSISAECSLMEGMVEEEDTILLLDNFAPATVAMCKAKAAPCWLEVSRACRAQTYVGLS